MDKQQVDSLALFQCCRMGSVGWIQGAQMEGRSVRQEQALSALCHGDFPG